MTIREAKKRTPQRPRLTCQAPGLWTGNLPASGVWHGSKRRVLGHCMAWALNFPQ